MPKSSKAARAEETPEEQEVSVGWIPDQEGHIPLIYSNHLQVLVLPWDFTLRFGTTEPSAGGLAAREHVRITWSPQHAKVARDLLTRQIQKYEELFGEIPDITAKGSATVTLPS
jgi:hypothetical protein